jgi:hypothetical protein
MAFIFEDPPYHHSGRHKHLEALIYVLEGEGYSEVQGRNEPWKSGDLLHVPPAMFEHEHYNDSSLWCKQLCIQFGIRFWFTDIRRAILLNEYTTRLAGRSLRGQSTRR